MEVGRYLPPFLRVGGVKYRGIIEMKNTKFMQNEKLFQTARILKRALEAWCMVLVLIMNKGIISDRHLSSHAELFPVYRRTIAKLIASIQLDGIIPLVLFVIFFTFYVQIAKIPFKKNVWSHIVAVVFSIFIVIGYSFAEGQNLDIIFADYAQMVKAVISFVGFYGLLHPCIKFCYRALDNRKLFARKETKRRWIHFGLDVHPFACAFVALIIAWLPYLAGYYPGIFMGDTGAQISQFFQQPNGTSDYLHLISQSQLINNHHPVLHTVLMGGAVKIGHFLGSDNLGIFLYTLFQYLCMAAALAYGISYLKKLKLPYWFQGGVLAVAALYPVFPRYAVLLSKDTLFSACVLVFEIFLIDMVRNPGRMGKSRKRQGALILLMLGVMMLRQNGLYIVLFSIPVLCVFWKNKRWLIRISGTFILALALYMTYTNVLFPLLQITPGSKREMLSVPFQQTARYVKEYGDELTKEERKAIDGVLDCNRIGKLYNGNISDPVKATYKEGSNSKELKEYFKVWYQMFWKHPKCYIEATLNNYYGYFYMGHDATDRRVRYYQSFSTRCMIQRVNTKGFEFHHLECFKGVREYQEMVSEIFLHLPISSILQASAFYTWLIILGVGYLLRTRRWKYLLTYLPSVCVLLVSMVSPVNGTIYFRYMLAVMFMAPVLIGASIKSGEYKEDPFLTEDGDGASAGWYEEEKRG